MLMWFSCRNTLNKQSLFQESLAQTYWNPVQEVAAQFRVCSSSSGSESQVRHLKAAEKAKTGSASSLSGLERKEIYIEDCFPESAEKNPPN